MAGTINPAVRGGRAFAIMVASHAFGLLLGATAVGFLLGLLGAAIGRSPAALVVLTVLAIWGILSEFELIRMRRLQSRWQVPKAWRALSPWKVGLLYGLGLGPGITTRITTSAFYLVMVGAVAVGSVTEAIIIFAAYALGRWAGMVAVVAWPSQDGFTIRTRLSAISRFRRSGHVAIGLMMAFLTGVVLQHLALGT